MPDDEYADFATWRTLHSYFGALPAAWSWQADVTMLVSRIRNTLPNGDVFLIRDTKMVTR